MGKVNGRRNFGAFRKSVSVDAFRFARTYLEGIVPSTQATREMTITISLSPEQEKRLAERAAQAGQEVAAYVYQLIDHDIQAESLDAILAPVRRNFEQSGMTDDDLAALVEEVREDIWREKHGRPSKTS